MASREGSQSIVANFLKIGYKPHQARTSSKLKKTPISSVSFALMLSKLRANLTQIATDNLQKLVSLK